MPDVEALYRQIGRRIAEARKTHGLTQERLAELVELNASYLARIEAGARKATVETLLKISGALHMPISALFAEEGESADGSTKLRGALDGLSRRDLELLGRVARRFERSRDS